MTTCVETAPVIRLEKILAGLKREPMKKFPTQYELELRVELINIIELGIEEKLESTVIIKKVIKELEHRLSDQYRFQRETAREYLKYFKTLIPIRKKGIWKKKPTT